MMKFTALLYIMMVIEASVSGKGTFFVYLVSSILSLYTWKNALIHHSKLDKMISQKSPLSLTDVINDPSVYDALTLASVIISIPSSIIFSEHCPLTLRHSSLTDSMTNTTLKL